MLLEIVTRTCRRPGLLRQNVASLLGQSDNDWRQEFLVDGVGLGIGASYQRLAHHTPLGEWVWILDDDDVCIHDGLVADVRRIAAEQPGVQVIMVKMDHGAELGILPDEAVWGRRPVLGHVGVSAYIVRRDVWQRHAHAFSGGRYTSDFDFIEDVFGEQPLVAWHDVVASRSPRRGMGRTELELAVVEPQERAVTRRQVDGVDKGVDGG